MLFIWRCQTDCCQLPIEPIEQFNLNHRKQISVDDSLHWCFQGALYDEARRFVNRGASSELLVSGVHLLKGSFKETTQFSGVQSLGLHLAEFT